MTDDTSNQQRSGYATEVLDSSRLYGSDPEGIQDMLSDMMHLCRSKGYDFAEILRAATSNFNAEVMDPEFESEAA